MASVVGTATTEMMATVGIPRWWYADLVSPSIADLAIDG
jgi:hypothetical protein